VSGKAPQTANKVAVECPHCGFKQLESSFAKSTFCRKCSEHYDIGKPLPKPREETGPSFFTRLGNLFSRYREWEITCFHCSATQTVNSSAKSSSCPQCGVYIDLTDFKVKETVNRTIETQGQLHVTSKGDVTSSIVSCRDAYIEGKVRGNLLCTGETRIKLKGKLMGAIDTKQLTIEKRSDVEAMRVLKAKSVTVKGKLAARLQVDGTVTVEKKGWLEGSVVAKGIKVEKGGIFVGELIIGQQQLSQPELLPLDPAPSSSSDETHPPAPSVDLEEGNDLKFGVG
jgi:cytoskeletal protein CcmA (bactofilin family)/predicted RNA-binding Zn-ribbon protein involved in translation (DUF1610 family)